MESLYDSLTGYFDPSKDRRRRGGSGRTKVSEEKELDEKVQDDIPGTSDAPIFSKKYLKNFFKHFLVIYLFFFG